jgi:hypothetical protein
MRKLISTIICIALIFGLNSLKINKGENLKTVKNFSESKSKNHLKNNSDSQLSNNENQKNSQEVSLKILPKNISKKFNSNKLFLDFQENNETKTADNENPNENEKEDNQFTLLNTQNPNITILKLSKNHLQQNHQYLFYTSVPTSPPNC